MEKYVDFVHIDDDDLWEADDTLNRSAIVFHNRRVSTYIMKINFVILNIRF